jgi:methanogenic corrinoid protein MtbC1
MIRWCSYCQHFLGERAPFDDPTFTHGICDACEARLDRDEPLRADTEPVRALMRRVLVSAAAGDETTCEAFIADARALGLGNESLLVGMLQPALYQAGRDWQGARMSVASEHRFTEWCERVFYMIAPVPRVPPPIDILLVQTPGNVHTVGLRFAKRLLAERGFAVDLLSPALPFEEMVDAARSLQPRFVGFSCAIPESIPVAVDLVGRLRERLEPNLCCGYVLSGFAFRLGGAPAPPPEAGIEVALDMDFFGAGTRAPGLPECDVRLGSP